MGYPYIEILVDGPMKTTIDIHDELMVPAKRYAKQTGSPLRSVVEPRNRKCKLISVRGLKLVLQSACFGKYFHRRSTGQAESTGEIRIFGAQEWIGLLFDFHRRWNGRLTLLPQ